LYIEELSSKKITEFNNRFEADGMVFMEPNAHLFSFNNPYGDCPTCEGYGDVIGIDEDLVIPNTRFQSLKMQYFLGVGKV
jgi:excinuclease ABC subunit A